MKICSSIIIIDFTLTRIGCLSTGRRFWTDGDSPTHNSVSGIVWIYRSMRIGVFILTRIGYLLTGGGLWAEGDSAWRLPGFAEA